jgi:hypothetical protein
MADKSDRLKGGGFNLCSGRIKEIDKAIFQI